MITIPFILTAQRRQWTIPRRDAVMSAGDTLRFAVTVYDSELSVSAKDLTGFTAELRIYSTRPQRDGYGYEYDLESGDPLVSVEGALQVTQGLVWFTIPSSSTRRLSTGRYNLSFVLQASSAGAVMSKGIINININTGAVGTYVPTTLGVIQFSAASYMLPYPGGDFTASISRTGSSSGAVTATVTDCVENDYPVEWADGDSVDKEIVAPFTTADTAGDSCTLTITAVTGATIGDQATAELIIEDVVSPGEINFTSASFSGGDGTEESLIEISAERTGGASGAVSVRVLKSGYQLIFVPVDGSGLGFFEWADGESGVKTIHGHFVSDYSNPATLQAQLSDPQGGATIGSVDVADINFLVDP